jgi:hypothetical protein
VFCTQVVRWFSIERSGPFSENTKAFRKNEETRERNRHVKEDADKAASRRIDGTITPPKDCEQLKVRG